jgi:hypothetical protein
MNETTVGDVVTLTSAVASSDGRRVYQPGRRGRIVGVDGAAVLVFFDDKHPAVRCAPGDFAPGERLVLLAAPPRVAGPAVEVKPQVRALVELVEQDFQGPGLHVHANPGDVGEVEHVERDEIGTRYLVRWARTGTAVDCFAEELALA